MLTPLIALPPVIWDPRIELRIIGAVFILGCLLLWFGPTSRFLVRWLRPKLAVAILCIVAGALVLYLIGIFAAPFFIDQTEYGVTNIGWWWASGHPMYPEPGALHPRDLYPYGPLTFELVGVANNVFGPGFMASRTPGVAASIVAFACTYAALRRLGARRVLALMLIGSLFVVARATWVQARLDPVSTALVSIALLAATFRPSLAAFAAIGIATGLSFALKIHGFIYILPALAMAAANDGVRPVHWLCLVITAALSAAAPFMARGVEFSDYIGVLSDASQDGLSTGVFLTNVTFVAMFIAAALLLRKGAPQAETPSVRMSGKQERALLLALAACTLAASVPASKPLAGPHHLLPFLIYVAALASVACQRHQGGVSPLAAPLLVFLAVGFQPIEEMSKTARRAQPFWETGVAARDLVAELYANNPAGSVAFCDPDGQSPWHIARWDEPTALSSYAVLAGATLWSEHTPIGDQGIWICATDELPKQLPLSCRMDGGKAPFSVVRCGG